MIKKFLFILLILSIIPMQIFALTNEELYYRQLDFNNYMKKMADFLKHMENYSQEKIRNATNSNDVLLEYISNIGPNYGVSRSFYDKISWNIQSDEAINGMNLYKNILQAYHQDFVIAVKPFDDFGPEAYTLYVNNGKVFDEKATEDLIKTKNALASQQFKIYKNEIKNYIATYKITTNSDSDYVMNYKLIIPDWTKFLDIQGNWAEYDIKNMEHLNIARGKGISGFSPNAPITRAEFVVLMLRTLNIAEKTYSTYSFKDLKSTDWYANAVETAYQNKLIGGYADGTMKPIKNITREEMAAFLVRALEQKTEATIPNQIVLNPFIDKNTISTWAKNGVSLAVQNGLIGGKPRNLFAPRDNATRAECIVTLERLLNKINK